MDVDAIEAALADAGWRAGAEALVAGWVVSSRPSAAGKRRGRRMIGAAISSSAPGRVSASCFKRATGDTWELSIEWPEGWGREHVSMRWREDLEETAERIVRVEGPFGGPRHPDVPMGPIACGRGRRLAGDVELRFELLREDLAAFFFIARDGTLNNLWVVRINPDHLPAALDSLERTPRCAPSLGVQAEGKRRILEFTAWRPLLARAHRGARVTALASGRIDRRHPGAHRRPPRVRGEASRCVRSPYFDAGARLAHATPWPTTRPDVGVGRVGRLSGRAACHPDRRPGRRGPSSAPGARQPSGPSVVGRRGRHARARTPGACRRARRARRAADASVRARARCLGRRAPAPFHGRRNGSSPLRLTGTATAVELWGAIRQAHKRGALPITGNRVDLVRRASPPRISPASAERPCLARGPCRSWRAQPPGPTPAPSPLGPGRGRLTVRPVEQLARRKPRGPP